MAIPKGLRIPKKFLVAALLAVVVSAGLFGSPKALAASCDTTTNPSTQFGQVTQTVNVVTAGPYIVWSRIKAPTADANSYYFQVDGGCALNVGDSASIPKDKWTWINYRNGTPGSVNTINLSSGTHTLTYTGKEADVQLDRILLLADASCTPHDMGDDCAVADTIDPTVSITSPTEGQSFKGGTTVNIVADAADNVAVDRVLFYIDGDLKSTVKTPPYKYAWDTTGVVAGTHTLTAQAYDTSDRSGSSIPVNIKLTVSKIIGDCASSKGEGYYDGVVGFQDLFAILLHYGNHTYFAPCDFAPVCAPNGIIDDGDESIVLYNWTDK